MMTQTAPEAKILRLQPKQIQFSQSVADIAIFGGSAGGGKTYSLLTEPLRYAMTIPGFGAVIFRRSYTEIVNLGGLWDEARGMYADFGGVPNNSRMDITFPPYNNRVRFSHLQYDKNALDWKGAQIPLIEFDQLETFTDTQFFYLLSRNRSVCGIRPYIRASANPEPGWLADFLSWWIAPDGYADLSRSGVLRWFVRINNAIEWGDSEEELIAKYPEQRPKSVTFIPSTIYDNQRLLDIDPDYLSNLMAQDEVDKERLLGDKQRGGNWKIKPAAGNIFNKEWFTIKKDSEIPLTGKKVTACRYWDFAATEKKFNKRDPDYTYGVLMLKASGQYYVYDVTGGQLAPKDVDDLYYDTTIADHKMFQDLGISYSSRWELEPGSASIRESRRMVELVSFCDASSVRKTGDKITEWKPLSAQCRNGNVFLRDAWWNKEWLYHMHGQPDMSHDDIADASAGAYNELSTPKGIDLIGLMTEKITKEEKEIENG